MSEARQRRPSIGFIGAGRVATGLSLSLSQAGYEVLGVASRSATSSLALSNRLPNCRHYENLQDVADRAQLVFITTDDASIESVAATVRWQQGHQVVHCSGALGLEALWAASAQGAEVGAFHPIQTFGPTEGPPVDLHGVVFGLEAQGGLFDILAGMCEEVHGTFMIVPEESRALYHAAAILSCGHLSILLHSAKILWEKAGLQPDSADAALGQLAQSTLDSFRQNGSSSSLTGPIVRGDTDVVQRHMNAIQTFAPEILPLYRILGEQLADFAVTSNRLSEVKWRELHQTFSWGEEVK